MKERVLSGMQASGYLHIGNLVGALQNWVSLQDRYECFYFIADWHALTTNYSDTDQIKEYIDDLILNFVAAGLDPDKCTIFQQSKILQHSELHILLSMITPLGWLERVPTYKEKIAEIKDRDLHTFGFLGYPVLQSADILIYRAKYVPVGVDQVPHLEITREIARRFKHLYKSDALIEPEALLTEFPKVVGTDGRKMSKTYNNTILLSDSPETVKKKIKTMVTDPARIKRNDPGNPELSPVYQLHRIFSTGEEQKQVAQGCKTADIGCIDCKNILIKNIFNVLEPIWKRRKELKESPSILKGILETGNDRARSTAEDVMKLVRKAIKL